MNVLQFIFVFFSFLGSLVKPTYAGFLDYIEEKKGTSQVTTITEYTINAASLAFGVGEIALIIKTGASAGRIALATIDLGSQVADLVINSDAFALHVCGSAKDCAQLQTYKNYNTLAQLTALAGSGFDIATNWNALNPAKFVNFVDYNNLRKLPAVLAKLDAKQWGDDLLRALDADLASDALRAKFFENPELVDSWKVLNDVGVDQSIRANLDNIKSVSKYLDETGVSPENFKSSLSQAGNKQAFLDELGVVAENGRRIPKTRGTWDGIPGESIWRSDRPEVNAITGGKGIPFKNGYPDFSEWSLDGYIIEGLTGHNTNDFALVYKKMLDDPNYSFKNQQEVKDWLRDNKITLHHHQDGRTIQLIPADLHGNIPHSGGAAILRSK